MLTGLLHLHVRYAILFQIRPLVATQLKIRLPQFFLKTANGNKNQGRTKAISQFQALATALAATVGHGQHCRRSPPLISSGGSGVRLFLWMWISALLGMMTAFSEKCGSDIFPQKKRKRRGGWAALCIILKRDSVKKWLRGYIFCFCVLCSRRFGE